MEETEYIGESGLRFAIVAQAVRDWRSLIMKRAWEVKRPNNTAVMGFEELRRFFRSDYALLLLVGSPLDPLDILDDLEEELARAKEGAEPKTNRRGRVSIDIGGGK